MREYLVELYVSRGDGGAVKRGAESARRAAERLSREGTRIRFVQSIFVPDEETCFFLYEAVSADAVREAATRASLPFEHVCEASTESEEAARPARRRRGAPGSGCRRASCP